MIRADIVVRKGLRGLIARIEVLIQVGADGPAAVTAGGDAPGDVVPPEERSLVKLEAQGDGRALIMILIIVGGQAGELKGPRRITSLRLRSSSAAGVHPIFLTSASVIRSNRFGKSSMTPGSTSLMPFPNDKVWISSRSMRAAMTSSTLTVCRVLQSHSRLTNRLWPYRV